MDDKRDVQGQAANELNLDARTAHFERELMQAMQRVDAPRSLAVLLENAAELEAAKQPKSAKKFSWFKPRTEVRLLGVPRTQSWMGGAIAAVLVLGCFGAVSGIHLRNERRQAEAERQFAQSEQITDRAMEHVRQQMEKAGVSLDGQD